MAHILLSNFNFSTYLYHFLHEYDMMLWEIDEDHELHSLDGEIEGNHINLYDGTDPFAQISFSNTDSPLLIMKKVAEAIDSYYND